MEPGKQPTEMIIEQIALLKSEERKLQKFVDYNKDAKPAIDIHLREIQKKKKKLYHLCDIMGIHYETEEKARLANETLNERKVPQPTGRFGSALINSVELK